MAWARSARLNLLCAPGAPASTSSWWVRPWQAHTPPHGFGPFTLCLQPTLLSWSPEPPTQPPTEYGRGCQAIPGPAGSLFSARKQAPESPWPCPSCSPPSHAAGVIGCARDPRGRGRPGLRVRVRKGQGSTDQEDPRGFSWVENHVWLHGVGERPRESSGSETEFESSGKVSTQGLKGSVRSR